MKLHTHQRHHIYIEDLARFIAEKKRISIIEARHMMPDVLSRPGHIIKARNPRYWCIELTAYMRANNIAVLHTEAI